MVAASGSKESNRDQGATAVCRLVRRIGMINARWTASNAETARSGSAAEIGIRLDDTH